MLENLLQGFGLIILLAELGFSIGLSIKHEVINLSDLNLGDIISSKTSLGNKSEILALIQDCNTAKGVDSDTEISEDILINKMKAYAQAEHMLLIASGATDIITDGNTVILNDLGHKLMKKITGAGCMSSCIIAPFLCINNTIESAYLATALMGYAANEAAEYVISNNGGTITFRNELINSISRINLLN